VVQRHDNIRHKPLNLLQDRFCVKDNLKRITLIGFLGGDAERKVGNATNIAVFRSRRKRLGRTTSGLGNPGLSSIDASSSDR
jgi:hypothetical protein